MKIALISALRLGLCGLLLAVPAVAVAQTGTPNPIIFAFDAEAHAESTPALHCFPRKCASCPLGIAIQGGVGEGSSATPSSCGGGTCGSRRDLPGVLSMGAVLSPRPFLSNSAILRANPFMRNDSLPFASPFMNSAPMIAGKMPCESCDATKANRSPDLYGSGEFVSGWGSSLVDNMFYNFIHTGTDIMGVPGNTLSLMRFHRSRDLFVAGSFGQGVVSNFDVRLTIDFENSSNPNASNYEYLYYESQQDLDGLSWVTISVPNSSANLNFDFDTGNRLLPQNRMQAEKLEIFDDQMQAVNGIAGSSANYNPYGTGTTWARFPDAKYAVLTNWDGSTMKFELFNASVDANWNATLHAPTDGRLIEATHTDGTGYTVSYKSWTQTEINQSPSRQWQIDQVTDSQGQALTFTYKTTQENGVWVVEKVTLPSSDEVKYTYAGGFLSEVEYPDTTKSTFSFSDAGGGMIRMEIDDLGAQPGSRRVTANISGSASTVGGVVVPTTVGLARMVRNGEDEVNFFNLATFTTTNPGVSYGIVYEGGGMMRLETDGGSSGYFPPKQYFKDGWTLSLQDDDYVLLVDEHGNPILDPYGNPQYVWQDVNPFEGTLESKFMRFKGNMCELLRARADETLDEYGILRQHTYDSTGLRNLIRTDYADGTFETYCYNSRHQITRYRDRNGNVSKRTYDASNRLITLETGLTDSSTNGTGGNPYDRCATDDVQTSERAVYQWQYHASGNGAGMLAKEIDPLGKETDYQYDTKDRLIKIIGPADTGGGTRPEYVLTYDSDARLKTVTNPTGDVVEYFYDSRHRLISTLYDDGSTEKIVYGTTGKSAGLVVKTIDRVGVVTTYAYDDADRLTSVVSAAAKMNGSTEVATPAIASTTTYAYIDGTRIPRQTVRNGQKSESTIDYRGRRVSSKTCPRVGVELESTQTYIDNQLFCSEDPYGRKTYYAYDATDGRLIRTVTGTTAEFSLADFSAVLNLTRDYTANADYIIQDTVFDAAGNVLRSHDGRNMASAFEYDSRGRQTAMVADADYTDRGTLSNLATALALRTETDYDLNSRVTEIRTPRYFDSGDLGGYQKARQQWTYTDRGLVKTHVEAPGTTEAATESFVYDLSGRRTQHTDFAGKIWKTHYEDCCGQVNASENPLGHGNISRADSMGRPVHQATVEDYSTHTTALDNPVDAKTYREVTTRYDGRGRPTARTTWLVARGTVDASNPPIAGLDSVSAVDGLTTQYLYDDNLADGSGLDATGGLTANQLGGGTYNVSLSDALTKLADTEANGGAGISFNTDSPGSAQVTINAEEEISFSIADAAGRTVMSGTLEPHDGTNPNDLISWNCNLHDGTTNLTGYGTVLVSKNINALGKVTKSHTDAAGRTIQSVDALAKITSFEYDAVGNQLKIRDPNSVGQDCTYDALGRDLTCTDTANDATS
ncbi:MAG: hypothetical protein MI861_04760, partial [Pirellulales bacterium]|nr:hypothetical protein [Pirellulales bacterium]